jgi:hypothetical protein
MDAPKPVPFLARTYLTPFGIAIPVLTLSVIPCDHMRVGSRDEWQKHLNNSNYLAIAIASTAPSSLLLPLDIASRVLSIDAKIL